MHDGHLGNVEFPFDDSNKTLVDLDRDDGCAGIDEPGRQRTETGTDFDDMIAGPDTGETHDAVDLVRIDEEVLTQTFVGAKAVALKQLGRGTGADAQSTYWPQTGQGEAPCRSYSARARRS